MGGKKKAYPKWRCWLVNKCKKYWYKKIQLLEQIFTQKLFFFKVWKSVDFTFIPASFIISKATIKVLFQDYHQPYYHILFNLIQVFSYLILTKEKKTSYLIKWHLCPLQSILLGTSDLSKQPFHHILLNLCYGISMAIFSFRKNQKSQGTKSGLIGPRWSTVLPKKNLHDTW